MLPSVASLLLALVLALYGVPSGPSALTSSAGAADTTPVPTGVSATSAAITITPAAGPPGTPVLVKGSGFQPGDVVIISYVDPLITASALTAAVIGADGSLPPTSMLIPASSAPGALAQVVARDPQVGAPASALVAAALFGVTPLSRQLTLSAVNTHPGDSLQVRGAGFGPGLGITLWLVDAMGTRTPLGPPLFSTTTGAGSPTTVTIPGLAATGTAVLAAVDSAGGIAVAPLGLQPAGTDTIAHLSQSSSVPGATLAVAARGFQAREPLQITLQDAAQTTIMAGDSTGLAADQVGSVSTSLTLPLNDLAVGNPPSGRTPGAGGNVGTLLTVTVRGVTSGVTRQAPLLVPATSVVVSPGTARSGEAVLIEGWGYHAGEGISLAAINNAGSIVQLGQATATADGTFSVTAPAPAPADSARSTGFTISATGQSSDLEASTAFSVYQPPTLAFSRYVLAPGGATDILGGAFAASVPITVTIQTTWSPAAGGMLVLHGTTDVMGSFSLRLAAPASAPVGPVDVQASDAQGQSGAGALLLSDQPASVRVSSLAAKAGNTVTVTGSGFGSGETVSLFLAPPSVPVQPVSSSDLQVRADTLGQFSAVYTVPTRAVGSGAAIDPGGYLLWARGMLSSRQAAHGFALLGTALPPVPASTPVPGSVTCAGKPTHAASSADGTVAYFANGGTGTQSIGGGASVASVQSLLLANNSGQAVTVTVEYVIVTAGNRTRLSRAAFGVPAHAAALRSVNADIGTTATFGIIVRLDAPNACPNGARCAGTCGAGVRVALLTHRVLGQSTPGCAHAGARLAGALTCQQGGSGGAATIRNLDAAVTPGLMPPAGPAANWYFAEGNTGPALAESVNLFNPDTSVATVHLIFFTASGAHGGTVQIRLQPFAALALDAHAAYLQALGCTAIPPAPPAGDRPTCREARSGVPLGLGIHSSSPIVAARTLLWGTGGEASRAGFDVSLGATAGTVAAHFAYGSTIGGDQGDLAIVNPAACAVPSHCTAQITVAAFSGSGIRLGSLSLALPPGYRATIPLSRLASRAVMSISVRATLPVVAEMAQYVGGPPVATAHPGFDAQGSRGGTTLTAGGFETGTAPMLIRVFNPTGGRIWVHVLAWEGTSTAYSSPSYSVGGNATLELGLTPTQLAGAGGSLKPGQPIGVAVDCSGLCVAAGLQGARGATTPLPATAPPEAWSMALN